MFIVLITGLILIGLSAALVSRAVAFGRIQAADRLRAIEMYGFQVPEDRVDAAPASVLDDLAERTGALAARLFPSLNMAKMRADLLSAGVYALPPETYLGYRVLACGVFYPLLIIVAAKLPPVLGVLLFIAGAPLAWVMPSIMLHRRAAMRTQAIDRELPELIDLLIVGIEAGVGLSAAQQMIADKLEGPLGSEMRLMLQEQNMGLSTDASLTNLLDRCSTPAVWSFVRSMQQGERLGMSIGTILRNLAVEMRTRRRQAAEERAQKAPVKMLFPLIFLIFPAMFIVLLGPAILGLKDLFAG